jgi:two-component system NtrC family sensor kinase
MRRGPKPGKAKVVAKRPRPRASPKDEASKRHDLEKRLAESLERETATSEILRVISSSPTDLQPVMDAVTASAVRLCGAYDAGIFLRKGEGLELVAHHGLLAASIGLLIPLVRGTTTGRSVLERQTIHVADVQAEAEEFPEGSVLGKEWGHRTILSGPRPLACG